MPDLVTDEEDNGPLIEALKSCSTKPEEKEAQHLPKTEVEAIHERMKAPVLFPEATDVEPIDNEMGAPLSVFNEEMAKERDELYQQCLEVRVPPAEERLKTQLEELMGSDGLDHLDALADSDDPDMRKAVKTYVLKYYTGHNLKLWPALQKILDGNA
jgi:hypothetical protein